MMVLPDLVVHADWGSTPRKRWMCVAEPSGDGAFYVNSPEPVGDLDGFWRRLSERSGGPRIVVGFDFPIGLPVGYARRAGIEDFRAALPTFGRGAWRAFYQLARHRGEISIRRPFYPHRPGGTRHAHLLEGLGVSEMAQLLRRCERPTPTRGAASPLFWTLGGKQVGRAAIIGWKELLAPPLRRSRSSLSLWPFDGDLVDLVAAGGIVVAETYPSEACVHLGISPPGRGWSKTSQEGRRSQAGPLLDRCRRRGVAVAPALQSSLHQGFGPASHGDDPFDAVVGLFSMLEVLLGHRPAGAPLDAEVRRLEGWILGQAA